MGNEDSSLYQWRSNCSMGKAALTREVQQIIGGPINAAGRTVEPITSHLLQHHLETITFCLSLS